jgi:hypothetical protein
MVDHVIYCESCGREVLLVDLSKHVVQATDHLVVFEEILGSFAKSLLFLQTNPDLLMEYIQHTQREYILLIMNEFGGWKM